MQVSWSNVTRIYVDFPQIYYDNKKKATYLQTLILYQVKNDHSDLYVYNIIILNSQQVETIQMSTDEWVNKWGISMNIIQQ